MKVKFKYAMLAAFFLLLLSPVHKLKADFSWNFPAASVTSSLGQTISNLDVGVSSTGKTIAIWLDTTGLVKASTASFGGSWTSPQTLSAIGASSPRLFVDLAGNAVAIWVESSKIKAATYSALTSLWSIATFISSTGATQPVIAGDSAGDVVAVWQRSGAIESSTMTFGGIWSISPTVLSASNSSNPSVFVSTNGNVIASWTQVVSGNNVIYVNEKTIATSWGTAASVSDTHKNSDFSSVAIGKAQVGYKAIVAWFSYNLLALDYFNVQLYASIQDLNGDWIAAQSLTNPSLMDPSKLAIATTSFDDGGLALVWTQSLDGSSITIEGGVFPRDNSFQRAPGSSPNDMIYTFSAPSTPSGITLIAGMKRDQSLSQLTVSASSSIYKDGFYTGFDTGLTSGNNNYGPNAALAQNSVSNVTYGAVGWLSYNGVQTTVQIIQGSLTPISPPLNLNLSLQSIVNAIFTNTAYALTWNASPSSNVVCYKVYRNGSLIFEDFNSALSFVDYNRLIGETVIYTVTALGSDGTESVPITIIH